MKKSKKISRSTTTTTDKPKSTTTTPPSATTTTRVNLTSSTFTGNVSDQANTVVVFSNISNFNP